MGGDSQTTEGPARPAPGTQARPEGAVLTPDVSAVQATLRRPGRVSLSPVLLAQLQGRAGNAAVAQLLAGRRPAVTEVQREPAPAPAPAEAAGPGDEDDVDLSEFTPEPARAAALLADKPPPPKAAPPAPAVGAKPPPPAAPGAAPPRVPAHAPGPAPTARKPGPAAGGPAGPAPGALVVKPAPPLPPPYAFVPGDPPPPPAPPPPRSPAGDPTFRRVAGVARAAARAARQHPTGPSESARAQGAARPPANDELSQAQAHQADTMSAAKPQAFDEEAFVAAVEAALGEASPKNLGEAENLDGKAAGMKEAIGASARAGQATAAGDVSAKTQAEPDLSKAVPKAVTPMAPLTLSQPPGLGASAAMPAPAPNEQLDFRAGPATVDQQMADAEITEPQLAESKEPAFLDALDAKHAAEEHARSAPVKVRAAEARILQGAATDAAATETSTVLGARGAMTAAGGLVTGRKESTKDRDEQQRKAVADQINAIFGTTKADVEAILAGLDAKVEAAFSEGEAAIRQNFTADWNRRLTAYKDRRYSGVRGPFRWGRDQWKGLPEEANELFQVSRRLYERSMKALVRSIARIVAAEMETVTRRIQTGRDDVAAFVASLKGDLATYGQEAAAEITERFADLDATVTDTFNDLAAGLAQKYQESADAVHAEITEAQEANKGLVDWAVDSFNNARRVVSQLKDLLFTALARIADAVGHIVASPIRFLGDFVTAVKGGVQRFRDKIEDHLQKGLMDWLVGSLGAANLDVPKTFDVPGMLKTALSVLGLTWVTVRERFVKKIGEKAMAALETGSDVVKRIVVEGPMSLAAAILEKFSNFEETVLGRIKEFVVEKLVKGGITFLVSLLNPAAAFVKACRMIYDIVMFLVERGSQIREFVETVIDAAGSIAKGALGGIAEKIESTLARLLPLALSFLGSLLGLGGLGDKIKAIVEKARQPMARAIDWAVNGVVKATAPIWMAAKRGADKARGIYEKGKAKATAAYEKGKGAVSAGAAKVREKVAAVFKRQEKGLSMAGAPHTITAAAGPDGRVRISMSSAEPELLSHKIGAAINGLEQRMGTAANTEERGLLERQVKQLREIAAVAVRLEREAVARGEAAVLASGAPPGFAAALAKLAGQIEEYGRRNKVTDITKATEQAVVVDLRLLSAFGLPMPSYLQAQAVADTTGVAFDIRKTNLEATQLLEQGALPKSEEYKQKTLDADDLLLGAPAEHLGKAAWFLPRRPDKAVCDQLASQGAVDVVRRWWARWRTRKDEYYDHEPAMRRRLRAGQLLVKDQVGSSGGVLIDKVSGLAYTGDHDLYQIHGPTQPVIDGLRPAPFRVQHGAHVDWPRLAKVVAKGGLTPVEQEIFNRIAAKHLVGGQALLRVGPKRPPTAVASTVAPDAPLAPQARNLTPTSDGTVIEAGPGGPGAAAAGATVGAPAPTEAGANAPPAAGATAAGGAPPPRWIGAKFLARTVKGLWRPAVATKEEVHGLVRLDFLRPEKGETAKMAPPSEVDAAFAGAIGTKVRPFAAVADHPSALVDPVGDGTFKLKPAVDIRRDLYGGFNAAASAFREARRATLENAVASADRRAYPPEARAHLYVCPCCAKVRDPRVDLQLLTLDHVDPVAAHWNRPGGGHDGTQAQRARWYSELANLAPMCKSCNCAKGGPPYDRVVGPNFRGSGE